MLKQFLKVIKNSLLYALGMRLGQVRPLMTQMFSVLGSKKKKSLTHLQSLQPHFIQHIHVQPHSPMSAGNDSCPLRKPPLDHRIPTLIETILKLSLIIFRSFGHLQLLSRVHRDIIRSIVDQLVKSYRKIAMHFYVLTVSFVFHKKYSNLTLFFKLT